MVRISVVIITLNEAQNLANALQSVQPIADEIIVVDSFSTDDTVAIAQRFGARVYTQAFEGYVRQKMIATSYATNDWVFSIDADEVLTPQLQQSILEVKQDPLLDAYKISRITNYCGKWIRHGGWYPDHIVRLFNRTKGNWIGGNIHERWEPNNAATGMLKGDMLHYSYPTISSHISKIEKFTELAARDAVERGKDCSILKIVMVPKWNFFVSFVLRMGFLDGYYGYVVSRLDAYVSFIKYTKTRQYARLKRQGKPF